MKQQIQGMGMNSLIKQSVLAHTAAHCRANGIDLPLITEGTKVKINQSGAFRHRTGFVKEVRGTEAMVTISMCVNAWVKLKHLEVA